MNYKAGRITGNICIGTAGKILPFNEKKKKEDNIRKVKNNLIIFSHYQTWNFTGYRGKSIIKKKKKIAPISLKALTATPKDHSIDQKKKLSIYIE